MEPVSGGYGKQYEQLRSNLAEQHIPIRQLAAGDSFKVAEGILMTVYSPSKISTVVAFDEVDLNEESLVFSISYGEVNVLFTADAGFLAEQNILNEQRNIRSTVLKVGHHGSRYSTLPDFLERVDPQVALISAGKGNSFGLPSQDTVNQLEKRSIRVYRTDNDGTIDLSSDGKSWNVITHSDRVKIGKK
jgi:competence protein ComEC